MSNDLERAYAALAEDAGRARLAPAATLRRRADRRTMTRSAAGIAAVAVLVGGVTVGTGYALGDRDRPPAPPAQSVGPRPSDTPSSPTQPSSTPPSTPASPPPSATSSDTQSGRAVPSSIPARAFLQESDAERGAAPTLLHSAQTQPALCGAAWASDERIGIRRTSQMLWNHRADPPDSTPAGVLHDTITVYRGAGARRFMTELRNAVTACPSQTVDRLAHRYRLLGTVGAGDDSVLIEDSTPAYLGDQPVGDGSRRYVYLAAVRVGDSVALVRSEGWEESSADRQEAAGFAGKAADRLRAWRS